MSVEAGHNAKIIDQFTRWAKPFSDLPAHSDAEGMECLLQAAQLNAGLKVIDVACGPGIVACAAARLGCEVTGIDITPSMIDQARARQQAVGLSQLDWHIGDATQLPFTDESFDVAITRYSFHHMPHPLAALREMKRIVRPGGRLIVADATPTAQTQAAYDQMETLRDPSHTSALTLEQLLALGEAAELRLELVDGYRLDARLETLTDPKDQIALECLLDEDITSGEDRTGVASRRDVDGIWIKFPISVVRWTR
ncbi:SAM-dependent methyltransferase [Rhodoblastus sphagnicola]|uniref:SAM-dependent methyltransferase n=1 Tax=Rhodoblastus sphagnicola TaxID=333368 RepID=A0A2S6NDI7_9HYPH|nr:methyltransferase domain-containing protein [Rhodoblastus sphagnicola]MBB4200043.1 ubiquinone/menaquinone biosynthesis C-methylase UbiE [Rhodoblastus sphagnicola]PPQ32663.1 SAM-dependent methyltransferase [Rhodoblastus sphagnicola]